MSTGRDAHEEVPGAAAGGAWDGGTFLPFFAVVIPEVTGRDRRLNVHAAQEALAVVAVAVAVTVTVTVLVTLVAGVEAAVVGSGLGSLASR